MTVRIEEPAAEEGTGPVTPPPERGWHRWLRLPVPLVRTLRGAPLTLTLTAVLWILGAATHSLRLGPPQKLVEQTGVGIATLAAGRWWTTVSSLFWCSGILAYLVTTALLLIIGPAAERRLGTARTALVLVVGQIGGTLLGTGLVRLGIAAGEGWTQLLKDQITVGPTVGITAVAAALSFRLTALWRRRLQLVVVLVPLVLVLYIGHLQSVQRLAGVLVGLATGLLMYRSARRRPRRSSHTETRVLVALCVVGSALGPLMGSLYRDATGPFNSFSELYFSQPPTSDEIDGACASSVDECAHVHAMLHFFESPGRLMAALIPVLLLVLAEGLRRGLRLAWWLTAMVQLLWIGLLSWLLEILLEPGGPADQLGGVGAVWQIVGEAAAMPVVLLVLLVATRKRFGLRLPARDLRWLAAVISASFLAACTAYVGIGWLVRDQYTPDASLRALLRGCLRSSCHPPTATSSAARWPSAAPRRPWTPTAAWPSGWSC